MKLMTTGLGNRTELLYLGPDFRRLWTFMDRLERLLNWLAGHRYHTFSVAEKLISRNLPPE